MSNSFDTKSKLDVNGNSYEIFDVSKCSQSDRLPYSIKILLENLLRYEDGTTVTKTDIEEILNWDSQAEPSKEIAFRPARVLMQDFTGVPAIVDLAAMRDAMKTLGGDPEKINPLQPAEMVIDHSVQVDNFGSDKAVGLNEALEFSRNQERYSFLKWGQNAFSNFKVVPPGTGIVHQINLEYLARVIFSNDQTGTSQAYPDTVVGTDSHTTMINGVGVLGWRVGGIESEASMLGQPMSMLIPKVVGFKLDGKLPEGSTTTDLVLVVVEILRKHGVVGKFVEFYGDGLDVLPLADRATIANMAPEYGATCGIFPIDAETIRYLDQTGRDADQVALVEAYAKATGMWREQTRTDIDFSEHIELDLGDVVPSLAGPKRPQDRIALTQSKTAFATDIKALKEERDIQSKGSAEITIAGDKMSLNDGAVVLAAITSCTNTSNPSVMLGAGLVARKAVQLGIKVKPWVKTSLAPGSRVVTEYLESAGVMDDLNKLGFNVVGYGCTTCIGNSGNGPEPVANAITENDLVTTSVLSGNRNFEGRIHALIRMNYLASPPLVVAYAIAGRMDIDVYNEPLAEDKDGNPVFLKDIWPTQQEVTDAVSSFLSTDQFIRSYDDVFSGESNWNNLAAAESKLFAWDDSTYINNPPYFNGMSKTISDVTDIKNARVLAYLGDSVTTDHISPAGAIAPDSPAAKYLQEKGVSPADFNSYGSRRGNHEVMMRGTFANIRLRNKLAPGTEGGVTIHMPSGEQTSIYDAAMLYKKDNVPTIILSGKEYGCGSSRDWAAKGPSLQGVSAVIAESYERIHRSNLVGMGILPLQYKDGDNAENLGLSGKETYSITGLQNGAAKTVTVTARNDDGSEKTFEVKVRIDTPQEIEYYQNGGILHYVLRQLAA
ncbi:MAG: aconitate hydratase AcnA [Gammaproteobacteria bacterium]|nr:aconitate hydratase AcnA [Gammaproteobacteria bacterium]